MRRLRSLTLALLSSAFIIGVIGTPAITGAPAGAIVHPVMSPRLSSGFGFRHHPVLKYVKHHSGIDLAAPNGSPIRAIEEGTVVFADPFQSYGNLIVVQHPSGMTSHYGHCAKISVRTGQRVKAGEIIGEVGSTGRVTGAHLHLEIRLNGVPQDPDRYLPGLTEEAEG